MNNNTEIDLNYETLRKMSSPYIGVAGGLGPNNIYMLQELLKEFPNTSFDAQGNLRNKEKENLDMTTALDYLRRSLEITKEDNI